MADTITGGRVRTFIMDMLESAAEAHDTEVRYVPVVQAEKHEYAAGALCVLHAKVRALPESHPAFEEMAAMCTRTECRCQRKDDDFLARFAYSATGYETAEKMLDAMLVIYRRVDRQEAAAKQS